MGLGYSSAIVAWLEMGGVFAAPGLLVGAALTQRPDLFAAAVAEVGLFDMLRYDQLTGGRAFVSEYGSAADPAEFKALYAYSPYHNVKDGTRYPPVFLLTADQDNRVALAHSLKFAARLQKAQAGAAPVLLQVMRNRGHGSGGRSSALASVSDQLAFLAHHLGLKPREGW